MGADADDIPVVFLDLDDCIATTRASYATGDPIDASAAGLLRRLCRDSGARIVLISTWRSDAARVGAAFARHDLLDLMWSPVVDGPNRWIDGSTIGDWRVDDDNGDRSGTISRWLLNHPKVARWCIVDDSRSNLDQRQLDRLVQPDMQFGLGFADVARAQRLLCGTSTMGNGSFASDDGIYQTPRHTISNQMRAAIDAIDQGDSDSAIRILSIVRDSPLAQ